MKHLLLSTLAILLAVFLSESALRAQGTGTDTTGTGTTGTTGTGTTGTTGTTGGAGGNAGAGTDVADPGNAVSLDQNLGVTTPDEISVQDDRTVQGFAGLATDQIIHPYSQFYSDLASGGAAGGGRGGNAGRGGGVGGNAQNGFVVTRRSIRARLNVQISAPVISGQIRSNRFNQRISRNPVLRAYASTVALSVEGRTGRLTGIVGSEKQKSMLERQARLEPGIYNIVNQIQVVQ